MAEDGKVARDNIDALLEALNSRIVEVGPWGPERPGYQVPFVLWLVEQLGRLGAKVTQLELEMRSLKEARSSGKRSKGPDALAAEVMARAMRAKGFHPIETRAVLREFFQQIGRTQEQARKAAARAAPRQASPSQAKRSGQKRP